MAMALMGSALAAHGESPTAFDRRCIPGGCVASHSNIPDILTRRALLGRTTASISGPLGATPGLHHGLLAHAQSEILLDGLPRLRVSENGVVRSVESIERGEAEAEACLIQRIGDRYYWATHENVEVTRSEHGSFVTFVAINGSGYVRVLDPAARSIFDGLNRTDGDYDYVEHFLLGMTTVTYFGHRRDRR